MKYKILIDGFQSRAEAEAFYLWYEGQGEQDSAIWLEISAEEDKTIRPALYAGPMKWNGDTLETSIEKN